MATILVVDDRPINREFLVTLLGYLHHDIVQAADGAEALALATACRPDLVITDVLMPVMDGVEFVGRLRADPALADIPVIFYTATYRLGDAWQMAHSCGVDTVIGKPASPQTILDAVSARLGAAESAADAAQAHADSALELSDLLGVKFSNWMANLPHLQERREPLPPDKERRGPSTVQQSLNAATTLSLRLAALLELGLELAAERDLDRLVEIFIRAARDIMNAQYAAVGLVDPKAGADANCTHLAMRGLPEALRPLLATEYHRGLLGQLLANGALQRLTGDAPAADGLPAGHPPVHGLLGLPVRSLTRTHGWLYFADKLGGESFSDEDEQIATLLSTKLSLACENLLLFAETQLYAGELEIEVAARRDSEALFRELAENIREVFWLVDPAITQIFYVSPAYETVWGRTCISLYETPCSWREGVHPDDSARVEEGFARMFSTGVLDLQFRVLRPDRTMRWVRFRGFPIRDAQGKLLRVAGLTEDISEMKQQQERITRLNRVLAVLSGINSAIVRIRQRPALFEEACRIAVEDGQFALAWIGCSDGQQLVPLAWRARDAQALPPQAIRLLAGIDPQSEGEGENHAELLGRGHVSVCDDLCQCCPSDTGVHDTARTGLHSRAMLSLREDGAVVGAMLLYAEEVGFFDAEEVRLLNELAGDISFSLDYIVREERLNYLAFYDVLTGLPNRSLFLDRVMQLLHGASHDDRGVALILLDLDHFKRINESYGRHVGDALLKEVGERLIAALEEPYSVAHIGADLYAIAVGDLPAHDFAMTVLRDRIFPALTPAFLTVDGEVLLGAHAGLALYPGDGDGAELLLARAEIALGQAKASGQRQCYFDEAVNARSVAKLMLETDLRLAVSHGQFEVYYQPKVSLHSGRIVAAEALIRWLHPERGLIGPDSFIPLAEETGLIAPMGEWVLRSVCAQQARWLAARLDIVPIAVNLSVAQFRSGNVIDMVRDALLASRLDPKYLELELTETILMNDPEGHVATLNALRRLGVGLSLDDFGTGYSSLAYLKRYPFSSVKIDRAFITDITHSPEDAAIADAAIGIARRLGMKTVAEGVETEGQMHYLRRLGCDEMQGYLFSRPRPVAEFEAMLRTEDRLALPTVAPADRRTLLLVDDEPNILLALQRVLRPDGYRVLTASNGRAGLDALAVNEVQVIISDQRMSGMSGAEFLSVARELYPDTIRIILSDHTDLNAVTDAVNHGAVFKFLTKPWDDELLRANVQDAFRWYRPSTGHPRDSALTAVS